MDHRGGEREGNVVKQQPEEDEYSNYHHDYIYI